MSGNKEEIQENLGTITTKSVAHLQLYAMSTRQPLVSIIFPFIAWNSVVVVWWVVVAMG